MQAELQDAMQSLVGIVRIEGEMQEAHGRLARLNERAAHAGVAPRHTQRSSHSCYPACAQ